MSRTRAFGLQPLQPALPSHLHIILPKFGLEELEEPGAFSQICNLEKGVSDANYREMAENQAGNGVEAAAQILSPNPGQPEVQVQIQSLRCEKWPHKSSLCIFMCVYQEAMVWELFEQSLHVESKNYRMTRTEYPCIF